MTVDLHMDTLWKITKWGRLKGRQHSSVNLSSLAEGQLDAVVFALYLPQHLEIDAKRLVDEQLEYFQELKKELNDTECFLALENGELLEGSLDRLKVLAKAGIKYLTLTHNYNNSLGCSATDEETGVGLTEFGEEVVRMCNTLGVLVDVSHTSFATAMCALAVSEKPVIASHSGCRKLLDHPRNLYDVVIRNIAQTGGLIGIPFVKKFVGTREAISEHIDHVVQLVGIHHAAIGSDIDGAILVDGADTANWFEVFANGLIKKGYSLTDISAIAGGNFQRLIQPSPTAF